MQASAWRSREPWDPEDGEEGVLVEESVAGFRLEQPRCEGGHFIEACPGTFCHQGEESVSRGSRDEDRKGQYHGGGGSSR